MNGVINIITRSAAETQGTLLRLTAGEQEKALSLRQGWAFDGGAFRAYLRGIDRGESELLDGSGSGDGWKRAQGGMRADLRRGRHGWTFQGDVQSATLDKSTAPDVDFTQFNVLGRWEHSGERVTTRVQMYFDHTDREQPPQGVGFTLATTDLELQQSADLGTRHRLVWGFGRRYNDYDVGNTPTLFFEPASRTLELTNVFAQDTISLNDRWKLTAGIKFERNSYSGWSTLPDLRLAWSPDDHSLIWAAAARAVRAPTPFDVDVRESFGGPVLLFGNPEFETEKVWAYEVGYRAQPHDAVSWSATAFYNDHDDLRSIEGTPVTFFPLYWGNHIEGATYGIEVWANWQVTPWWRLSPGFRSLRKRLEFSEGGFPVLDLHQAGNDPSSHASLKSSMNFGKVSIDGMLRYVGNLPSPAFDSVTELSARFAWQATDSLEISLSGFNLLDDAHREYAAPTGNGIRRSVQAELRWTF
jgi:iron complex outermembrane receptor protein